MIRTIISIDVFDESMQRSDRPRAWLTTEHPSSSYGDPVLIIDEGDEDGPQALRVGDHVDAPFYHAAGMVYAAHKNRWTAEASEDPIGHVRRFLALAKAAHLQRYESGRMVDF